MLIHSSVVDRCMNDNRSSARKSYFLLRILGCFRSLPEATSEIISLHLSVAENHNIVIPIFSFVAGFVLLNYIKRNKTQGGDKHCEGMFSNNST